MLLGKFVHLLSSKSGVGEHTNLQRESAVTFASGSEHEAYLVSDVVPIVLAAEILEILLE